MLLPQSAWDTIVQLIFEPTYDLKDALVQIRNLSLISQSLHRACKNAVLRLDASRSLDAHVAALATLPIAVKYLDLNDLYNREYVLRSATFIQHSAITLKHVAAAVRCTDTLEKFPNLETLTLYGQQSFPKLSISVFTNVHNLKHLELVNYEHSFVFNEVPVGVLGRLESFVLKPVANRQICHLHDTKLVKVPLMLKRFKIDSSIDSLQAVNFAPCPSLSLSTVLTAAEEIVVEGGFLMLEMHPKAAPALDVEFVGALLNAPKSLKRLEFRSLHPYLKIQSGTSRRTWLYDYNSDGLTGSLEREAPGGVYGDIRWSFRVENQSIFEVYCLRLWRHSSSCEYSVK